MSNAIDIDKNEIYEGSYWHVSVIISNRFEMKIEWTCGASDSVYSVPRNRVNDVIEQLRKGITPEEVAKTLPIG